MIDFYNASPLSSVGHAHNISTEDIDRYFSKYIPIHLHSVAENISSSKSFPKLTERVLKSFDK